MTGFGVGPAAKRAAGPYNYHSPEKASIQVVYFPIHRVAYLPRVMVIRMFNTLHKWGGIL
jgi:hypothetical protein